MNQETEKLYIRSARESRTGQPQFTVHGRRFTEAVRSSRFTVHSCGAGRWH